MSRLTSTAIQIRQAATAFDVAAASSFGPPRSVAALFSEQGLKVTVKPSQARL
jgi:hypothetical protein